MTIQARREPTPASTEPRTASPRYKPHPTEPPEGAVEALSPENAPQDEAPKTVRVPINNLGLFGAAEYIEVPVEIAGQWDERCWRSRP